MTSTIYALWDNGIITELVEYSAEPKTALIAFIHQTRGNYNTWDYPAHMPGIIERRGRFYYMDPINNRTIASMPGGKTL